MVGGGGHSQKQEGKGTPSGELKQEGAEFGARGGKAYAAPSHPGCTEGTGSWDNEQIKKPPNQKIKGKEEGGGVIQLPEGERTRVRCKNGVHQHRSQWALYGRVTGNLRKILVCRTCSKLTWEVGKGGDAQHIRRD